MERVEEMRMELVMRHVFGCGDWSSRWCDVNEANSTDDFYTLSLLTLCTLAVRTDTLSIYTYYSIASK